MLSTRSVASGRTFAVLSAIHWMRHGRVLSRQRQACRHRLRFVWSGGVETWRSGGIGNYNTHIYIYIYMCVYTYITYCILYYITLHYSILYYIVVCYVMLYYIISYHFLSYHIISYYIILYYIILYFFILYYIILYYIILYYIILLYMSFQTGTVQYSVNSVIGLTEAYRDHAWYWGDFLWWPVKAGSRLPLLGCFVLKYVTVCDFQKKLLCRSSGIPNVRICKNSVDD